jgi:hypothetical protein
MHDIYLNSIGFQTARMLGAYYIDKIFNKTVEAPVPSSVAFLKNLVRPSSCFP